MQRQIKITEQRDELLIISWKLIKTVYENNHFMKWS